MESHRTNQKTIKSAHAARTRLTFVGKTLIVPAVLVLGVFFAIYRLTTLFRTYDDEGYILLSLAHYIEHGHLYTETFSQYGPFYFYAQGIFFQLLHIPLTHDTGRLVTLIYWLTSALLAAQLIYKLSKSILLGCAAGLGCVIVASVVANEPGHPQQLVLLLFMLGSSLSLLSGSGRTDLRLFVLGGVGAALVFTKVNVGIFYIAALAHTLFCLVAPGRIRRIGIGFTLLYAVCVPWILMQGGLQRGVQGYCLFAIMCGTLTFLCGSLLRPDPPLPLRNMLWTWIGLLITTGLVVIATLLQGLSLHMLVQGVLLDALKHSDVFFVPFQVSERTLTAAAIVSLSLIGLWLFRRRLATHPAWIDGIRCAVGAGAVLLLVISGSKSAPRIEWVVPFLPIALWPGTWRSLSATELFPRVFITTLSVTELLQAYPVAGNQVGIAAVPILLWAFICMVDGIEGLNAVWGDARLIVRKFRLESIMGSAIILVLAGVIFVTALVPMRHLQPRSSLSGSTLLHLAPEQESEYEFIARSVRANCDVLYTMPGMGSFNFWSGVPTPNGFNLTAWMKGLDSERQKQILAVLQSTPRACAIYNPSLVRFWETKEEELAALPLARYIMADMPKVAARGGYEIRIHPQRQLLWVNGGS
jgi:hypothetical protein